MTRRNIQDLAHQEQIDQLYLASHKQLRPNRNGQNYLQLELADRTGSLTARLWNATEASAARFEEGDVVRVKGAAQLFQGLMQIILTDVQKADPSEIDWAAFAVLTPQEIDKLRAA